MDFKRFFIFAFSFTSLIAFANDNKLSAEIFPLVEDAISTVNDAPDNSDNKTMLSESAKSTDLENLTSSELTAKSQTDTTQAETEITPPAEAESLPIADAQTEVQQQAETQDNHESKAVAEQIDSAEALSSTESKNSDIVEVVTPEVTAMENKQSTTTLVNDSVEHNHPKEIADTGSTQTSQPVANEQSSQELAAPSEELSTPIQDDSLKTKSDFVSVDSAKPANSAPIEESSAPSQSKNIAEKAYETIKEVLKTDAESRSKILDEKKSQPKEFPKNEILTIDSENPKQFRGLPKFAIEKVPGLAKDKSASYLTLKDTVQTSIISNPEVLQSYKSFEGAVKEADAAWGRYLPSVDLNAYYGQENRNDPLVSRDPGRLGAAFTRSQASLSVRQMLFDGFFTKTEVERLSRTSRARLFELEEQSNATALESIRAYTDLVRFRRLTELTEDNYVNHKVIYEQLVIKANAGVGKKSDVEQAKSRLALAEYNMTVEGANLHDIEARFQKVVGFLPPEEIDSAFPINKEIPNEAKLAINKAQLNNPKLLATIEDALSQQALLDNKDAAFMPKVDLRMRADRGNDLNSFNGYHGNDVAEVVVSWNLFNGNSDVNFKQKERALLEAAINRRDKFCRDIRLELEIAYNDIKKLTEQYNYLESRAIAIEKARDAYRKQFEIGQRTLIDLLNTENELFEAKRLLTNVQNDLNYAYARTHYQMGSLLGILDVTRYASTTTAPRPSSLSELGSNIEVCPAEAPTPYKANKKNLDSRALQFVNTPKDEDGEKSKSLNKDFKEMTQ